MEVLTTQEAGDHLMTSGDMKPSHLPYRLSKRSCARLEWFRDEVASRVARRRHIRRKIRARCKSQTQR